MMWARLEDTDMGESGESVCLEEEEPLLTLSCAQSSSAWELGLVSSATAVTAFHHSQPSYLGEEEAPWALPFPKQAEKA